MIDSGSGAKELPRVRNASHVELHGVGVDPDGDGAVLHQPLRHFSLVT